ncbi:MAG TPA: serine hydrolase domain-containing protein [Cyclobacteriaceae bacterium]
MNGRTLNLQLLFFIVFFTSCNSLAQQPDFRLRIDSLITAKTATPFNGIIVISQNGVTKYSKAQGYSDFENKILLNQFNQFVIGPISKQITAVLVLQESDKGNLKLNVPIRQYLPKLNQPWADTVTIHQLLTHTHGITELDKPLSFKAGSSFAYSQIGYDLLAKIIEQTSKKSFADLSAELFSTCKMYNTFHPSLHKHKNLVKGYTELADGNLVVENNNSQYNVAAGGFISTANDLVLWNNALFIERKLLKRSYAQMIKKQKGATRNHPLFGSTDYGYGITIDTNDNITQLGQTGFVPGFASMNFYFPESKTSVIVLENVARGNDDLKKTFYYHLAILKMLRADKMLVKQTVKKSPSKH